MASRKGKKDSIAGDMPTPAGDRIDLLRDLFPEVFVEGKLDVAKFRNALGDIVDERPERYSFTWAGKRDAIRVLQMPSRATLVPCPEESVNWDTTKNVFIEGDNLEVLKLLYKSYSGRVKLIYIDPPYNTGQDFIYPDNFTDPLDTYLKLTGQKDESGNLLTSNPETNGRFHSAWLSMMYPRLFLARQLLREDGAIFVSIDDTEVAGLKMLMNEIFGEENFISAFVWQKRYSRDNRPVIGAVHDYVLLYARSALAFARVRNLLPPEEASMKVYKNPNNDPRGRWRPIPMTAQGTRPNQMYKITTPTGVVHEPPAGRCWSMVEEEYKKLLAQGRIWFGTDGNGQPNVIRYLSEVEGFVPWTWWPHTECGHTDEAKKEIHEFFGKVEAFDTPKPIRLMRRIVQITTDAKDDEIVLDFFAGSCSMGHAVMEQNKEDGGNRRFIMVQLPEPTNQEKYSTISAMGRERLRQAGKKVRKDASQSLEFEKEGRTALDVGFRCFTLFASHNRQWTGVSQRDPDALAKQMALFVDPLLPGWEPLPVIHEIAMREGFSLSCRVEELPKKATKPHTVYLVTDPEKDQRFRICLDDKISPGIIKALELGQEDVFICRDVALTDEIAANLALQCRLKTI